MDRELLEQVLQTLAASVLAVVVLFILTKITGKRQISQMSLFDYINGITIGSIAAELATMANNSFIKPLIGLVVYAAAAVFIALAGNKSIRLRRLFEGRPLLLYNRGAISFENLRKSKVDLNEFLTAMRTQGYFDLSEVEAAILETNGKISVLPLPENRPLTPADMKIRTQPASLCANVVIDGRIMENILSACGRNEQWLRLKLREQDLALHDCVLATVDGEGAFRCYRRADEKMQDRNFFL